MFKDVVLFNPNQERVYAYLRQYIGGTDADELRRFLRFVTDSTVCMAVNITLEFNTNTGAARRPILHTCDPMLELSSCFDST